MKQSSKVKTSSPAAKKQPRPAASKVAKSKNEPTPQGKDDLEMGDLSAAQSSPPTPADARDTGGAANAPAECLGIEKSDLKPIESSVAQIHKMKIDDVREELLKSLTEGDGQHSIAIRASKLFLAIAWKCGMLLNHAKALLKKKKEFGDWRDKHFVVPDLMSVKTAQRYMALARHWESLDTLLSAQPNLWQAYQDCGILPQERDADTGGTEGGETEAGASDVTKTEKTPPTPAERWQAVLAVCSSLQGKLALVAQEKVKLPKEDLVQLQEVWEEVNKLFASILSKNTQKKKHES